MPLAATMLATVLLVFSAAGCGDGGGAGAEPSEQEVMGQGEPYLSAADTATVAQAYRQVKLACTEGRQAADDLEPRVRAAAAVASREPDKIFRAASSDEARPVVDTMANIARELRACGHAKLATQLLSHRRKRS